MYIENDNYEDDMNNIVDCIKTISLDSKMTNLTFGTNFELILEELQYLYKINENILNNILSSNDNEYASHDIIVFGLILENVISKKVSNIPMIRIFKILNISKYIIITLNNETLNEILPHIIELLQIIENQNDNNRESYTIDENNKIFNVLKALYIYFHNCNEIYDGDRDNYYNDYIYSIDSTNPVELTKFNNLFNLYLYKYLLIEQVY